jgi:Cu-Zn family superoxide dismutase
MRTLVATCALIAIPAIAAFAAEPKIAQPKVAKTVQEETASAEMKDAKGNSVGEIKLTQAPNGLIVKVKLWDLPPGEHAFHIHEVGKCEPPFKSAGGHFNPTGHHHGIQNPDGQHAGDMPNLKIEKDGKQELTVFLNEVTLSGKNRLLDENGTAFVIHSGADDYISDPAGNAGDRIACGVVHK